MELQEADLSLNPDKDCEEGKPDGDVQLSKNQLKKLKKREKWMAIKQEKRRNAKLKRKLRLAEMRENGEDIGPTRKSLKRKSMKNSSCKIRVAIDLSLDEYMVEKDVSSLTCQLQHSYAANRRAENSLQLYFCGIGGKTKERLDKIGDYKGWDIYPESESYDKVFPVESLVYLSSESDNVLTSLSEDKVYVIGGLVDHNKHKGLCHRLAEEKGIAHAQLPIGDYLDMKTRKVLTVNQVFSILLRYTETKDWKKAFLAEMPQRKNVSLKEASSTEASASPKEETQNSSSCQESKDNLVEPDVIPAKEIVDTVKVPQETGICEGLKSIQETGDEGMISEKSELVNKGNEVDSLAKGDNQLENKNKYSESSLKEGDR
ncbi:tRNA (guanine(9)-N1)-methyltransferase [Elysia marginata]|uniref:tRNA (guanine(9)-N(1))-methyltransferase n=1 Tax=Elysia marginata TaxID=1093978 RepID=A0AAV4IL59_9GAST|nr:tRNA (guanine(9)-N1)-methyltransferase [Elysia marginata]